MSKNKVTIRFKTIYQLWQYAQAIQAKSIEIHAGELLLRCDCSEEDLQLLQKHGGTVVQHIPEMSN